MRETQHLIPGYDGRSIPAVICESTSGSGSGAMSLLLHGITTHKDEYGDTYKRLAGELAEAGQSSIRIDFRGHGESAAPLSEFNVHSQVRDLLATIDWLDKEQNAAAVRILAASFAAPAAVAASLVLGTRVGKLALLAPVLDVYETFVNPHTGWGESHWGRDRILAAVRGSGRLVLEPGFELNGDFAAELLVVDPKPTLARLRCPVVILHGNDDGMVPLQVSEAVARDNANVRLTVMDRTEHGLAETGDEDQVSPLTAANYTLLVGELTSA
jgi:pimeloyl-ACP methyl ester carboxylesterase